MEYQTILYERIETIKQRNESFASALVSALNNAEPDPKKAMLECGYILEIILSAIIDKQGIQLDRPLRDHIEWLDERGRWLKMPPRIIPRVKFVWSMVDVASSAEKIELDDVHSVIDNLLYVVEWFQISEYSRGSGDVKDSQELEILPQLKAQYKQYLKSDIVSVKFRQTESACFLRITREEDLGFITGGSRFIPELEFKPQRNIRENIRTLLYDFGLENMFETLDLFRPETHPEHKDRIETEPDDFVEEDDIPM